MNTGELPFVKLVLVGDDGVGKTSTLITYSEGRYPGEIFANYLVPVWDCGPIGVEVDKYCVYLSIWDTEVGDERYTRLRALSYGSPPTQVVAIFFSLFNRSSFKSVKELWLPEILHNCPKVPILLVGTKTDLREVYDNEDFDSDPKPTLITKKEGEELAKEIGAISYHEISAFLNEGLRDLFTTAIKAALTDLFPPSLPLAKPEPRVTVEANKQREYMRTLFLSVNNSNSNNNNNNEINSGGYKVRPDIEFIIEEPGEEKSKV
eukprot:TRINITY_DN2956_c0_g1_i2.p1 TRINITY_DN2956_c0_g1~~TRINITY_DN2956_c0_g1_i2.p1  ORF type:complete len:263 (-),score=39.62 TRINITY_DN2956_c0_g1_i2:59-847(-)